MLPLAGGSEGAGAFSLGYRISEERPTEIFLKGGMTRYANLWRLVAVGGDYTKPGETTGTAAWSEDDGKHWFAATTPPHGYRSAVQWSKLRRAWIAAGSNGSDLSRDDGRTWQALDNGDWNALSLPFIVGPKGRIGKLDAAAIPSEK